MPIGLLLLQAGGRLLSMGRVAYVCQPKLQIRSCGSVRSSIGRTLSADEQQIVGPRPRGLFAPKLLLLGEPSPREWFAAVRELREEGDGTAAGTATQGAALLGPIGPC